MDEWMKQPVSYLKKLVKSRAGRVAELQMEIKILEGIIVQKVSQGDLGGEAPRKEAPARPAQAAPSGGNPLEGTSPPHGTSEPGPAQVKVPEAGPDGEPAKEPVKEEGTQSKIINKSSSHAFQEID